MHDTSNTSSMQTASAQAMPEHAMPDAQAMPNDARGRDRELPTNSPSTPTTSTSTRELGHAWMDGQTGLTSADAAKLLTLAAWFDRKDDTEGFTGNREVQTDLRRIAWLLIDWLQRPVDPAGARVPVEGQISGHCGYTVIHDGEEEPCDRPAAGWRWYQDVEHEDTLDVACELHANEGGRRVAALGRVRALHTPEKHASLVTCGHCYADYPCPTVLALDGA